MSSTEAYAMQSFGSSGCYEFDQPDKTLQNHCAAPSIEEALRRHGSLSEAQIIAALDRIEAAEAWLGPVAVGKTQNSD